MSHSSTCAERDINIDTLIHSNNGGDLKHYNMLTIADGQYFQEAEAKITPALPVIGSLEPTQPLYSAEKEKKEELFGGVASAPSETGSSSKEAKESKPPQLELPVLGSLEPTQPLHSAETMRALAKAARARVASAEATQPAHSTEVKCKLSLIAIKNLRCKISSGTAVDRQKLGTGEQEMQRTRELFNVVFGFATKLATRLERTSHVIVN
ncbi:unnamed protein product [Toxocara canis]|uniref:Uncharacterized protein n=1 Tax=Toxocara canis TaxID=6265 RepID=A0A183V994_TOXCA|nr:unnamed protein product [Toxocara canis]